MTFQVKLYASFCWLVFWGYQGSAQTLHVSAGEQFFISQESVVVVNGNVNNLGILTNEGNFSVGGDWNNAGVYQTTKGRFILHGEELQQIHHNGQPIAILHLQGAGEKQLSSPLLLVDSLVLQEGILTTSSEGSLTLMTTAGVAGGNELAYINGPMVYQGTGYRYFPVGKNNHFRPITLLEVKGADPVLQVEVQEPNENAIPGERLESVSEKRYWEIKTVEGTYEGSLIALSIGEDEGFRDVEGIIVTGTTAPGAAYTNLGQSDLTGSALSGTVTSREVSALPYVALGITSEFSLKNQVLVPSAFAPEAPDPQNRALRIYAVNVLPEQFVLKIFDRWGQVVYQTTSLDEALQQGWNGLHQKTHQPAQFGVYTYYVNVLFDNQIPKEQTGTITLFR